MSFIIGGFMALAGLIVLTNLRGAADWLAVHVFGQLIGEGGGIGKVRLVGASWVLIGVIAIVFMRKLGL